MLQKTDSPAFDYREVLLIFKKHSDQRRLWHRFFDPRQNSLKQIALKHLLRKSRTIMGIDLLYPLSRPFPTIRSRIDCQITTF